MDKFSVVTSVYRNDNPLFVKIALDSMLEYQTLKPAEIVLVQDGPISEELDTLIREYESRFSDIFSVIRLNKNQGLGNALQLGVRAAKYDYIARMDSDDICLPNRFKLQVAYLNSHPECDIVGGQMTEFIDSPENICGKRVVPESNSEIYAYMKKRCGLNHVTVMFKKDSVLDVGNYKDWFWNEDYFLWIRMMLNNCQFSNLPDVLVNVRSGADQYSRRGGMKYFKSEIGIKRYMLQKGLITRTDYYRNVIIRFIVQILLPNSMRGWILRKFARE